MYYLSSFTVSTRIIPFCQRILAHKIVRETPAYIANDGKQTPMRGHPVFIAQHATATCCRECIRKWHKMQPGKELSQVQQDYLVDVIMTWIQREMERQVHKS